ncbi:MAG: N-acetylmuramic acid 6-phosphate etherase [Bacteroidetes bacterium]|nr:N-acetylmuramic acid 6-phosphate etherase [Bacteroidota bacterium]
MVEERDLFKQLNGLLTEQRNPASMQIDCAPVEEILRIINAEDTKVASAVARELPAIANAVELIVEALHAGGRLLYVGAGTSGRLGVLDAVECPPTFGIDPSMVQGIIAGGDEAMFRAIEGAEDRVEEGTAIIQQKNVSSKDVVCGIAASLRTPFVCAAVIQAKKQGAKTILVTTNPRSKLDEDEFRELASAIDVAICPEVGPEVVMGSTRMKSGTAQKMVLNMLSTASMIRLGKVYENMMIDLQMTNNKLRERAKRIVMISTGLSYDCAANILEQAGYHVKTAIVMAKLGVTREEAQQRLQRVNGFVRLALRNE